MGVIAKRLPLFTFYNYIMKTKLILSTLFLGFGLTPACNVFSLTLEKEYIACYYRFHIVTNFKGK
jgi:hypothetical protein